MMSYIASGRNIIFLTIVKYAASTTTNPSQLYTLPRKRKHIQLSQQKSNGTVRQPTGVEPLPEYSQPWWANYRGLALGGGGLLLS